MPALIFHSADGQRTELPLKPGVNRIGRVDGNDILVPDESVAETHCEVTVDAGQIFVRDLGTSTGTAINNSPVAEGPLLPGESLRVGNVEFTLHDGPLGVNEINGARQPPPAPLVPGEACRSHPMLPAKWRCTKCGELSCDTCVTDGRALGVPGVKFCRSCKSHAAKIGTVAAGGGVAAGPKSMGGEMAAAWTYPFRQDGWIIMLTGAIFFGLAGFAQRFMFLLGGMLFVFSTGFFIAYSQSVVQTSARGDDSPPTWPDVSDFYSDILLPFLQGMALQIVYLGPVAFAFWQARGGDMMFIALTVVLLLAALFMMPMAWLAISMHETVAGLSPHVVIPSILRIPGTYMIVFVELVILVAVNIVLEMVFDKIPIVGGFLSSFLSIYFMMVVCRLLGTMYYLNRKRIGWF